MSCTHACTWGRSRQHEHKKRAAFFSSFFLFFFFFFFFFFPFLFFSLSLPAGRSDRHGSCCTHWAHLDGGLVEDAFFLPKRRVSVPLDDAHRMGRRHDERSIRLLLVVVVVVVVVASAPLLLTCSTVPLSSARKGFSASIAVSSSFFLTRAAMAAKKISTFALSPITVEQFSGSLTPPPRGPLLLAEPLARLVPCPVQSIPSPRHGLVVS